MSGGSLLENRGCSTVAISSACENFTLAFGNFFLYDGMCTSVAYLVPSPPLKMTTSSSASALTPNGLSALFSPWA